MPQAKNTRTGVLDQNVTALPARKWNVGLLHRARHAIPNLHRTPDRVLEKLIQGAKCPKRGGDPFTPHSQKWLAEEIYGKVGDGKPKGLRTVERVIKYLKAAGLITVKPRPVTQSASYGGRVSSCYFLHVAQWQKYASAIDELRSYSDFVGSGWKDWRPKRPEGQRELPLAQSVPVERQPPIECEIMSPEEKEKDDEGRDYFNEIPELVAMRKRGRKSAGRARAKERKKAERDSDEINERLFGKSGR